ncbi:hypothetical protein [Acuticoccus sp.]|uniref:hypothetical protein n=1 Tax=Acuticoccus sp. TaxID=1904378 RepID=UPI003B51D05A
MRANPAVPGQTMAVRINGEWAGEHAAGGGDVCPVVVPLVGSAWRSGGATNRITLHPSASSRVGADERNLGVALVSTELS